MHDFAMTVHIISCFEPFHFFSARDSNDFILQEFSTHYIDIMNHHYHTQFRDILQKFREGYAKERAKVKPHFEEGDPVDLLKISNNLS